MGVVTKGLSKGGGFRSKHHQRSGARMANTASFEEQQPRWQQPAHSESLGGPGSSPPPVFRPPPFAPPAQTNIAPSGAQPHAW